MKLKKGDQIKIITGNDKGKQGKILAVFLSEGRLLAAGINMKKKHMRPRRQGQKGELVKIPAPIYASRAMLVCGACGKPTRIGFAREGGKKTRICKKCGKAT